MAHQRCQSKEYVYDTNKHSRCPFCIPSEQSIGSISTSHTTTVVISDEPSSVTNPVAGWLVIVKGKGQSHDLKITPGINKIGREEGEIKLSFGDNRISSEKHAYIAYDSGDSIFMIQHGEGKNSFKGEW